MWDARSEMLLLEFTGHEDAVNCVTVDWAAGCALSGCDSGFLLLWSVDTAEVIRELVADSCEVTDAHHGQVATQVNCILMDTASGRALSGRRDGIVRLWDLE